MPNLAEPFNSILMEEKLSQDDLLQVLRADIAGELEAIINYDAHAKTCNDPRIAQILMHLRDEERQHVGALMTAINLLDPKEASYFEKGRQLVERSISGQMAPQVTQQATQQPTQQTAPQANMYTANQLNYNQGYAVGQANQHLYQSPNQYSHHDEPM